MMPITDFLSCTHVFDGFESLSPAQCHHAKTYATGLVAASNKTVAGIAREVLPAGDKRALNKFLTEYDWDEQQFNHERLNELQKHGETRWSKDGYIILDDTINRKAGDEVPGVGHFYDHAEGDTVWGQDLIYAFYADDKTAYPLTFRLYEKQDEDDSDHDTKYDLAREIITELEDEVGVPADTYLFDSWFAHDSNLVKHIESYGKDWIGPLRSNRQVTYGGEEIRVDALEERIDTVERHVGDETYHIWTKKLPVSQLGDVKLVIAEKETDDEDKENPVKYLATNKIDAPTEHIIRSYGMRWRIETFFEDSKQDLGLGDCEMQTDEGASRHWHLLMAAYSLVRLDFDSRALGTVRSKASSLRANLEHSLKEAVYNLLSWVRDNDDRSVDDLMEEIDHLFVHSTADANVQS
ncbi:IS701 family transposase (plasmid) [Halorubrum sp. BOL3-1]|uniref:IS701 family transposase n=1 Tax=Halorubrum sp. BOL3-1 TaxID=2497325 RepID=UPI001004F729|nr:IS701 family transposase [Halorubrum sp. BOL3-1]QAU14057.1 IS701 family transposase [Halorubrum sp. BOL3-1]QAU14470.1 IS701 family transposase [Halorubrum sp. BOL3-1]